MEKIISVILVTYNCKLTIKEAIDNIYANKNKEDQLIIIDGGSNDGTINIIRENASKVDFWASEEDDGIYDAMNKGTSVAKGDFIYFIGCDDSLIIHLDEIRPLLSNRSTIYYGDILKGDSNIPYDGAFDRFKLTHKNIGHQCMFYPSSTFIKYSYNLKYSLLADYELNLKLFNDGSYKFKYINRTVARYGINGKSSTYSDKIFKYNLLLLIFKYLGLSPLFYFIVLQLKKIISSCLRQN